MYKSIIKYKCTMLFVIKHLNRDTSYLYIVFQKLNKCYNAVFISII